MKWAFDLLGLPIDTDAASVKRAYARLLRNTRPDEDPEAFQQLHTAYKAALAHASNTSAPSQPTPESGSEAVTPRNEAATHPASPIRPAATISIAQPPASTVRPVIPAVNIPALANEVVQQATHVDDGNVMQQWLHDRQEFWSIAIKQQTGRLILQSLFKHPQAMSTESLDALLSFFDLDHVLSGINPIALQELRSRQLTLWQLEPHHHRELAREMQLVSGIRPRHGWIKSDLASLKKPLRWHEVMWKALVPGRVRNIGWLARIILGKGGVEELPPSIDRHHTYFWYRASTTGGVFTTPRLIIGAWRASILALTSGLLAMALLLPSLTNQVGATDASNRDGAIIIAFGVGFTPLVLWLFYLGCIWLDHWQGLPESAPSRRPWSRRLFIPALCGLGTWLYGLDATYAVSATIVFASLLLALRRWWRRTSKHYPRVQALVRSTRSGIAIIGVYAAMAMDRSQEAQSFVLPLAIAATLFIWLADTWRYRAQILPRFFQS
ncbi:hypothetical protein [Dyella mobilis]|uniref:J domain-containing protein n=1 Tax=Dyella mobilis TaxID=1849582 RepID=A0ABS2KL72_9GAMM|nr:hypothetical protein [Dyella mobilis]MBM7131912.1 hypothetical protein [Dyella mobilis]GLQ96105.1 hypothetical protein GCM10007863_05230 [Dyella mobilis]